MGGNIPKRASGRSIGRTLRPMSGEAKVNLAVDMSSTVTAITIDSIRKRHPGISKKKLFQLTKRRLQRRPPIRMEEAVPFFAETERPKLRALAGRWKNVQPRYRKGSEWPQTILVPVDTMSSEVGLRLQSTISKASHPGINI